MPAQRTGADTSAFEQLLHAARIGDRDAFGRLLKSFERYLRHAAREQFPIDLQAKGGASDLIQETFLKAHRHFCDFTGTTEAELLAWLRCLFAHNIANFIRDYRHRQKRLVSREQPLYSSRQTAMPAMNLVSPDPGPQSDAILNESAQQCRDAIKKLSPTHQDLLRLRFHDGLSYSEIGARLNMSEDAVRKLITRVLRSVSAELQLAKESAAGADQQNAELKAKSLLQRSAGI